MMGYKMSEQAASLRMPLYIFVYAFKQDSRTIAFIMSGCTVLHCSAILLDAKLSRTYYRESIYFAASLDMTELIDLLSQRRGGVHVAKTR